MFWISAQHKSDAAFAGALGDVGNALRQKRVMSQVGMRIKRHRRKEDDDRLSQRVGGFDRNVERWIIERALGTLHPVHDATERVGRAGTPHGHARICHECFEGTHVVWKPCPLALRAATFSGRRGGPLIRCYQRTHDKISAPFSHHRCQHFVGDGCRFHSRTYVMHSYDVCSAQNAGDHGSQRAVKPLVRRSIL